MASIKRDTVNVNGKHANGANGNGKSLSVSKSKQHKPVVDEEQVQAQKVDRFYPNVSGLPKNSKFMLGKEKMHDEEREKIMDQVHTFLRNQQSHFLGYQLNQKLDYSSDLATYLDICLNNIGDPFTTGNLTTNTKFMERAVLDYYAQLWRAKWPHNPKDGETYWGFCLTMGSTEANLYGMWQARDYLRGKFLLTEADNTVVRAQSLSDETETLPTGMFPATTVYAQAKLFTKKMSKTMASSYFGAADPSTIYSDTDDEETTHEIHVEEEAECEAEDHAFTPVAFFSADTHYSFAKAMEMLDIPTFSKIGNELYPGECPLETEEDVGSWPQHVPCKEGDFGPGTIDIDALATLVEFFASRGYPILVSFNYGTTFKGAYDNVEAAGKKLIPILKKYNLLKRKLFLDPLHPDKIFERTGYWFHVDGALGAAYMPFVEMAHRRDLIPMRGPRFDFKLPFVCSISMSGHKWPGASMPCGIFMTRTKYQLSPPSKPHYLGSQDTTFAGSRNGLSVMLLWHQLSKRSYFDQMTKVVWNEALAKYAYSRLRDLEKELDEDLYVGRTPLALTVRFKQAIPEIVSKYSLSNEVLYTGPVDPNTNKRTARWYSHIFIMDHVTGALIDELVKDLSLPGSFIEYPATIQPAWPVHGGDLIVLGRGFHA